MNRFKVLTFVFLLLLSLTAVSAIVEDDFNRADETGWGTATNGNDWTRTNYAVDTVRINDSTGYWYTSDTSSNNNGIRLELSPSPSRVDFILNITEFPNNALYIQLTKDECTGISGDANCRNIEININSDGRLRYRNSGGSVIASSFFLEKNTVYEMSFRNINYITDTYDFYVDDSKELDNVVFYRPSTSASYINIINTNGRSVGTQWNIDCLRTGDVSSSECDANNYLYNVDAISLSPSSDVYTTATNLRGSVTMNDTADIYINYTYLVNDIAAIVGQWTGSPTSSVYTLPVLDNTYFAQKDNVTVKAFAVNQSTGARVSLSNTSSKVTIINRVPTGSLTWSATKPLNDTNFTGVLTPGDSDLDTINISYEVFKNGVSTLTGVNNNNAYPYGSISLFTIDASTTNINDTYTFNVSIFDGFDYFVSSDSENATVSSFENFTITLTDQWSGENLDNFYYLINDTAVFVDASTSSYIACGLLLGCYDYTIVESSAFFNGEAIDIDNIYSSTTLRIAYNTRTDGGAVYYYVKSDNTLGDLFKTTSSGGHLPLPNIETSNYLFSADTTIITTFISESLVNISILKSEYFEKTYLNVNLSENLDAELYQSVISFAAINPIDGSLITGVNFTVEGNSGNPLNLSSGSYTVTSSKTDFFNTTTVFSVSALDIKTVNITDFYNSVLYINATNGFNGLQISNFSINWSYQGTETTLNDSSTGLIEIDLIQGFNYSLIFYKDGFIPQNINIVLSETNTTYTFTTFKSLDVQLNFFDEISLDEINGVTFEIFGDSYSNTFTTGSGNSFYIEGLPQDVYEVRFYKQNFSKRSYHTSIPLVFNNLANVSLYLLNEGNSTLFLRQVVDQGINPLAGYYLQLQRPYTSSDNTSTVYRTMEISLINSQGEAVFNAITNTQRYRFRILNENLQLVNTLKDSFLIDINSQIVGESSGSPMSDFNTATDATTSLTYVNDTGFVFDFTAPSTVVKACLELITTDSLTSSSQEICVNSNSDTLVLNPSLLDGSLYTVNGYLYPSGQEAFLVASTENDKRFAGDRETLKVIGPFLYAILILFSISIGGFRNATTAIIMAVLGTVAFSLSFLGLFVFSTVLSGGLIIIGIIILLLTRENQ